jgi:hypothetical protein
MDGASCAPAISGASLRAITSDRAKLRTYLLRVAMIEGIRRANAII